jgi:hypothetical protein
MCLFPKFQNALYCLHLFWFYMQPGDRVRKGSWSYMKRDGSSQLISVSQSSSTDGICSKVNSTVRTISFPFWGGSVDKRSHIAVHNVDLSDCGVLGCEAMTQVCMLSQPRRAQSEQPPPRRTGNFYTLDSASKTWHAHNITVPLLLSKRRPYFQT